MGNALTAAARLGSDTRICSCVADDENGQRIVSALASERIECDLNRFIVVDRTEGVSSPFTYIIADRETGSRTCIHTPGPKLQAANILDVDETDTVSSTASAKVDVEALLHGASTVFFDGRHTEGAIEIAKRAKHGADNLTDKQKSFVVVEAESVRDKLDELLDYADGIICSKHFPTDWSRLAKLLFSLY